MTVTSAGLIVRQFFQDLEDTFQGKHVNPYATMSDDVEFIVTGQTPLSGTWRGMKAIMSEFLPVADKLMGRAPGHGLFPLEYIEEDNRVVVLARGRGSNIKNVPYNNTYFLLFEVRDGKIIRYIEDFDSSHAWQIVFDCHLQEKRN